MGGTLPRARPTEARGLEGFEMGLPQRSLGRSEPLIGQPEQIIAGRSLGIEEEGAVDGG